MLFLIKQVRKLRKGLLLLQKKNKKKKQAQNQ